MSKIPTVLAPPGEELLKINGKYHIEKVEEFTHKGIKGYRITLSSVDIPEIAFPLWTGESGMVNQQSKLGAFLKTFGNDTDMWLGQDFQIVSWGLKSRVIVKVA